MNIQMSKLIAASAVVLAVACERPADTVVQPAQAQGTELPGISWTQEEIRAAVAPVRAGRTLTPTSWPNGAKVAVVLSFDVDNESLARGQTLPGPMSAGQYGATTGLPRVLRLLDRHELPASFYIPAASLVVAPSMVKEIMASGRHEIGVHGWIHESLPTLDNRAEEQRLLNQAIEYLTEATGKRPVGYRAPAWAFSRYTLGLIREAGFLYDSSLMAMDQPYELVANGEPTGLIELPVEWIQDDAPYFGRNGSLPSPELIFDVYRDEFDIAYEEGTMLMLTMHPHVSGHRSRIVHLDRLIQYMKSKPDVWFTTAEEIANYIRQQASF